MRARALCRDLCFAASRRRREKRQREGERGGTQDVELNDGGLLPSPADRFPRLDDQIPYEVTITSNFWNRRSQKSTRGALEVPSLSPRATTISPLLPSSFAMTLIPHFGLSYPPPPSTPRHARHNLDLYLPSSAPKGLIVFTPGGAWVSSSSRDESLDALHSLFPQDYALAVLNYRLSGQKGEEDMAIKHPSHILDVQAAVEYLIEGGAGGLLDEKTRSNVWIIGHSAGGVSTFRTFSGL